MNCEVFLSLITLIIYNRGYGQKNKLIESDISKGTRMLALETFTKMYPERVESSDS